MSDVRGPDSYSWPGARVVDRLLAPVAIIAADSTLLYTNRAASRSLSQEPSALVGRKMLDLVHPEDRQRIESELRLFVSGRRTAGTISYRLRADPTHDWRVFESIADNLIDDPDIRGIFLSSRDMTEQIAYARDLYHAAYRDPLTGLANRAKLNDELENLMAGDTPLAVAIVGVDRFNVINDSLGHAAGDNLLIHVAERIRSCVPPDMTVGRFGGDTFVLIVQGEAAEDAASLLWRVVERIREPLFLSRHELQISSSVGVARRDATSTADSLLHEADLALHCAKSRRGGRVALFRPRLREAAVARLELEANLRLAIDRAGLSLALQPIVGLADRVPVRAEALARWHHEGTTIGPLEFIPIAEETGLVVPLGEWIIDRAAQLVSSVPGRQVMVNLSARQLSAPGLTDRIARALAARRLPRGSLGFEVTETLLIEDFDYAVNVLQAIRRLGCQVGLDDFGTGYSSLGYLRRLPIDFLKIDGSLITGIDHDHQASAIVGSIISMADALGLDVVAEGVETEGQAATLRDLGCGLAQGYLFGRPREP